MRQPDYSGQFKRDVKQLQKRGKDMTKLKALLELIISGVPLPASYLDHPLKGDWRGYRDAYIERKPCNDNDCYTVYFLLMLLL